MIEQPEEATPERVEALAREKPPAIRPRLERFAEGRVAQSSTSGPSRTSRRTIERLHAFIAEQGLRATGRHHEIYLSDPRRTAPERLRTILRQPVASEEPGMENLIPIGRFSRMTRLSVKALRHYDELGLLAPAVVDPFSSYRYYTYSQANRAEAIRILRGLDMPLEQIRELLESDDPEISVKLLEEHRGELEERLERHRRMLTFIERLIQRKEGVMPYEVQVKELAAQHAAVVRRHTTAATIGQEICQGFGLLGEAIGRADVPIAGPPFLVMQEVIDEVSEGEFELGFPVAAPFEDAGEVRGAELPATTVAWTLHHGPYDEVGPAYHTLTGWIQEHGHEIAGPPREVYLTDPQETPDPADYVTEVQFPIR